MYQGPANVKLLDECRSQLANRMKNEPMIYGQFKSTILFYL